VNICTWRRYAWLVSILVVVSVLAGCTLFNAAPVADFEYRITWRFAPGQVVCDASASRDPDGAIVSYEWDFGDGSTGSEESIRHTYAQDGTYTIRLSVTDNQGKVRATSQTLSILPSDVPPPPSLPPAPPLPPTPPPSPILVCFEGSGCTQSPLPFPKEGAGIFFMEYSGGERFSVVVLDCWSQWVKQLADEHGDYEGWAKSMGGSDYPGPYSLDVDADGSWVFTFLDAGVEPQAPPQTYRGCGSGNHFSLPFRLASGRVAFYYSDGGTQGLSYFLVSYSGVEAPLAHEMDVLANTYLLRVRSVYSGGCWEVRVEQAQ